MLWIILSISYYVVIIIIRVSRDDNGFLGQGGYVFRGVRDGLISFGKNLNNFKFFYPLVMDHSLWR